ncbi:hypothetical protein B0I37DRAFT_359847 [Chaetomium sp. MPI-CAGE-AT-0009]|nr:hypothetical protein B0I37DRAFT_359847 [Chaetomium sp. MPI-CAGE-AT-0009]
MSSSKGPKIPVVSSPGEEATATANEAQSSVFNASPVTEAAIPVPKQGWLHWMGEVMGDVITRRTAPDRRPFVLQSIAEGLVPDWDARGPDAFPERDPWLLRGLALSGQRPNDIRVIDVESDGTRVDRGEAAFDQANPFLQLPLPQGSGVCRLIIGVPELGRVDREFARRAVNLAGEKIRGANPDGATFEKTHFRSRISPGFDLARLRDLWTMDDVAWKPFLVPVVSIQTPTDNPEPDNPWDDDSSPAEGCVCAFGKVIMYPKFSWVLVQTIPLQGDRFLFLCTLPSRKLRENNALQSAADLADIKRLAGATGNPSHEQIFEVLSRDQERTCQECFVRLLLSNNSATRLADGKTDRLCQLLLLDIFRAVSEAWLILIRDIKATMGALNVHQLQTNSPESTLMELKSNCDIMEKHLDSVTRVKHGAEHLLQWLSFDDDAGEHEPGRVASANERWLKKVTLALQADLEHSRFEIESFRDFWTQLWTDQGEHMKRLESKNVARLTLTAAVFLPLSFGADLLGMQFRVSELGLILYDYLGLVSSAAFFLFAIYRALPGARWAFGRGFREGFRRGFQSTRPRKETELYLIMAFHKSNGPSMLIILWIIFVVSFMIGMTGDIPRSLVLLKYGAIAWGALFALYNFSAIVYAVFWSQMYKLMGWAIVG